MKKVLLVVSLFMVSLFLQAKAGGPPFNSPFDESNPVLAPDGRTLFVTIANHPQNLGGKRDPGDIWISTLGEDNQWSAPVHAGTRINDKAYNGVAGFSADGTEMFLLTHYDASIGVARTQGISVSRKGTDGWSRPENIKIPYFQNKSNIISGYISPDKKWFVYSAETYGSYGVEDLFMCERKSDGMWSAPKNLGPQINTQFQELAPSLSFDGKTLFYSSNGKKGKGSFDVFSASRLDESWTNWTDPVNLPEINSDGKELYYREFTGNDFAIFTSTKNSDGYGDIRFSTRRIIPPADSTEVAAEPVVVEQKPVTITETKPVATASPRQINIYGKVYNSKTGESIPARIAFVNSSSTEAVSIEAGKDGYRSEVKSIGNYTVKIEARGFISTIEKLDVQSFEMSDLEMNFKLQPADVGTTVNLRSVLFEQSKTNLLPESYQELDLVVSFLRENPNVKIDLSGHTDNRGVPFQNIKLSQGRVDVVRDYLISKGIDARRITGKGYGGARPIASNESEETRKLNRRVEFTIQKN